ncbi:MAG: LamG domain-containing protein, partial [Planctomycetota bacterium]
MCRKLSYLVYFALVLALAGTNVTLGQIVWEGRISSGADDYEQYVPSGDMDSGSSDLEITEEGSPASNQLIGLRFNGVLVPQGANIASAYVQFHVDEVDVPGDNRPGTKFLRGEAVDNAAPFLDVDNNMSSRPTTTAEASWDWPEWLTVHEEGPDQRTSNIAAVIQEIVDRPGWSAGNSLVLIISGTGENTAEAFEGESAAAALLHIEFSSKFASNPSPADGVLHEETWASLDWTAGETAVTHDVYMSDNFDDVNDRAAAAFLGNQAPAFLTVGFPGFPYPDGLVPGTTYYWAVDEVEADGVTKYRGPIWSFSIPSKAAYNPSPRDGGKAVQTDVTLSWTPGFGAKLHSVYFGDDFDTVSNAAGSPPQGVATFTPGTLEKDKVYYWRVDEFNPPETVKGDVWSFRTVPDIVITDPDLIGWWKLDNVAGNTVLDWSGYGNDGTLGGDPQLVEGAIDLGLDLDGSDYISIDGVADDLTANVFTLSIWIKTTMSAGEGTVFGSNTGGSHDLIFGVKDGQLWAEDSAHAQFPPPPDVVDNQWHMITYVRNGSNATLYVDGVQVGTDSADNDPASETRWSIGQEWDDSTASDLYRGMVDDARIYKKALTQAEVAELMRGDPLVAWNPKPGDGLEIDVERAKQPLTWSPGDNAAEHDVYLGTDSDAVATADASTADIYRGRQAGTAYSPPEGLEWGTGPYYWRIDEYNTDGTVSGGSIWSFTIADYILVEDFEGYT